MPRYSVKLKRTGYDCIHEVYVDAADQTAAEAAATQLTNDGGGGFDAPEVALPTVGAAAWGGITGVLSAQTDLDAALSGKASSGHNHDAAYAAIGHTHPGGSEAFAVGSGFISFVSTNPATLLGYGTWASRGAGRVLVGVDAGDPDFDAAGKTGGSKTVTLAEANLPAHTHAVTDPGHTHVQGVNSATTGGLSGYTPDTSSNTRVNSGYSTSSATTGITLANTGSGAAFSVMNPFIAVYLWERTA